MKKIKEIEGYIPKGYTPDELLSVLETRANKKSRVAKLAIGKFTTFGSFRDLRSL